MKALLWDVNISEEEFRIALHDKYHPEHRWALIRFFTIFPTNNLFCYITRDEFVDMWPRVRDTVEKDFWGRARVDKLDWLYNFILKSTAKS